MTMEAAVKRDNARVLMLQAQGELAEAGAIPAATYLEYAIACLDLAGATQTLDDGEPIPKLVAPRDPVLSRAMGGALAIIGTALARSNIVDLRELAHLFGIYATVSADDDPACGTIIAGWGGMMLDAAPDITGHGG